MLFIYLLCYNVAILKELERIEFYIYIKLSILELKVAFQIINNIYTLR